VPRIDFPILSDGTNPILTKDGRLLIDWAAGFEAMPTIQHVAREFGVESWSPKFFVRWHEYLRSVSKYGASLVTPFPDDVCNLMWSRHEMPNLNRTDLELQSTKLCQPGTAPVRVIAECTDLSDPGYPMVLITQQYYDPATNTDDLVKFAAWTKGIGNDEFLSPARIMEPTVDFPNDFSTKAHMVKTAEYLSRKFLKDGTPLFDLPRYREALRLENGGVFNRLFDTHILVGNQGSIRVMSE
jgi:hypothetical protein